MREHQPHKLKLTLTPRMSNTVWLSGVAVVLLLWAVIVGVIGGVSGRWLDVAGEGRLLAPFILFLCGWTSAWFWRRRSVRPNKSTVADH